MVAKNPKRKRSNAGREIIEALTDLAETLEAGIPLDQKYSVRTLTIPEPTPYGPREVKSLRTRLGVSQVVFAKLIGASAILVQKWEGGDRKPDGMARRLMDDIGGDPQRFLKTFVSVRTKKTG